MGVARVATSLGISLIKRVKTRVVVKIKQVVLMLMLQRRIAFMHFALWVNKRVLPMW